MRKRFHFGLQRLFDIRKRSERKAQQALATLNREKASIEAQLREAEQRRIERLDLHRTDMVGVLNIDMLRMHASISQQQASHARSLLVQRAALEPRIGSAMEDLLEIMKKRRGVECLHDKALMQWKHENRKSERREESEIGMLGRKST